MSQAGQFQEGLVLGAIETLTGNSGGAVSPDGSYNVNLVGAGDITIIGSPGTNTLTVMLSDAIVNQFDADTGSAIPVSSIINIVGSGVISTSASGNTVTISATTAGLTDMPTDSGTATVSSNEIDIVGSHGINTAGATNVVTVALNNTLTLGDITPVVAGDPSLTLTTGDIDFTTGSINFPTTTATAGVIFVNGSEFMHAYGTNNAFLGVGAGNFTLTANSSVGIGTIALNALTSGVNNTAVGHAALALVTSAASNTAVGNAALYNHTTGTGLNTTIGEGSLYYLTTGTANNGFGYRSLLNVATGQNNIGIGVVSGDQLNGTNSHNICINSNGVTGDNNTLRIGAATGTGVRQLNKSFIHGITGITAAGSSGSVMIVDTNSQIASDVAASGTIALDSSTAAKTITIGTGAAAKTITMGSTNTTSATTLQAGTGNITFDGGIVYTLDAVSSSPHTVAETEYYLSVDCSGGAITINLPNAPTTGRVFMVKDSTGSAASNNITVTTAGGSVTIDGATTFVMNTAYEAVNVIFNGTSYEVW